MNDVSWYLFFAVVVCALLAHAGLIYWMLKPVGKGLHDAISAMNGCSDWIARLSGEFDQHFKGEDCHEHD